MKALKDRNRTNVDTKDPTKLNVMLNAVKSYKKQ